MIAIADVHLGKVNDSRLIGGVPSQTLDIVTRLNEILDIAVATKQTIVVMGDVFNRVNPPSNIIAVWFQWLSDCASKGVKVFLIAGNHDSGVDWVNLAMVKAAYLPNVTVATAPSMVLLEEVGISREVLLWPHLPLALQDEVKQTGLSVSEWVAKKFPEAEFVITHGQYKKSEYENDIFFEAGNAMEVDPTPFKKLKLMLAGHIHDHCVFGKLAYPGSLTCNNFGEVDEHKGYYEVDLKTLSSNWVEFDPSTVTPWVQVDIDLTEKDETSISEEVVENLVTGAIVKLVVHAKKYGVINEAYIRDLFNKHGLVTRFEMQVDGAVGVSKKKLVTKTHAELLKDFVVSQDASDAAKDLAIKIGSKIIQAVLG